MNIRARHIVRRFTFLAVAGIIALVLTACTGRGGGQLPPDNIAFKGSASFGFSFSCEDSGGLNPQTGQLRIELSYSDKGANPIGTSFGIHGTVDQVDPVLESAVCIGDNPPPGQNVLTFLGRYRLTSPPPAGFASTCPASETDTTPLCRFEVTVVDKDKSSTPSQGDSFSIKLSNVTASCDASTLETLDPTCSELHLGTVFYARAGTLSSGNLTVD